ncbi:hypothetical protein B9K05_13335 [Acetobacter syzygii]|uniref:Uncharacterized protein n=1 Tax=Acetobacter syzygii TaxID=146476 RepID=A0A270B5I0_9PROT|nr:hypothetical protein B9K05_13335 [Acetobacter syzygii]PAL20987.1 hypothetical protein B9K04_13250 [Acetobacter syzygii]
MPVLRRTCFTPRIRSISALAGEAECRLSGSDNRKASKIEHVQLRPESTHEMWVAQIGTVIHVGNTDTINVTMTESLQITVRDGDGNVLDQRNG